MELILNIEGHTTEDLANSLREALRLVGEGYTSSANANATSSYKFDVTGSPVEEYAVRKAGDRDAAVEGEKRYKTFAEAADDCAVGQIVVGLRDDGEVLIGSNDVHGEDAKYLRADWTHEVREGNTQLGYWEWVSHSKEADRG